LGFGASKRIALKPNVEEGQGSLGELQKVLAVPVSCDEEFTCDFRSFDFRPPDGLTFADHRQQQRPGAGQDRRPVQPVPSGFSNLGDYP